MSKVQLFLASELDLNEIRQVELDDREPIAIYNLDGEYFATDDTCTHGSASMAEGDIDGSEVYCPFHMGAFDIRTGEPTVAPCSVPLKTYDVVIEDGYLFILMEDQ
ncbi:MAG: non-heme iron oxygenase ferredoxin subunit [Gammaproteobacteria bacterium]|jgi:nitrite reductase/ring-hydroxylating ferredoxin subunit